jgi:hypothetical protein
MITTSPVPSEPHGISRNRKDHLVVRVSYPVVGSQTANARSSGLPLAGEVVLALHRQRLTDSASIVGASAKALEGALSPTYRSHSPAAASREPVRRARKDARLQRWRPINPAIVARRGAHDRLKRPTTAEADMALSVTPTVSIALVAETRFRCW